MKEITNSMVELPIPKIKIYHLLYPVFRVIYVSTKTKEV